MHAIKNKGLFNFVLQLGELSFEQRLRPQPVEKRSYLITILNLGFDLIPKYH